MKILNDLAIALVQPKKYGELLPNKAPRVALYVLIILLISFASIAVSAVRLYKILGEYYSEHVPDFTFENQTLTSSDTFDFELAGMKIMMDTSRELTPDDFGDAKQGILADSDSILIRVRTGGTIESKYTELTSDKNFRFTKDSLYEYKNIMKVSIFISALMSLVIVAAGFMLSALIIAGLSSLLKRTLPQAASLSFGQLYKLALYSRGLPSVLSLILSAFIGGIPWIISIMLSVIILNTAITSICFSQKIQ